MILCVTPKDKSGDKKLAALGSLIDKIVEKASKDLDAEYDVEILTDMEFVSTTRTVAKKICDHMIYIENDEGIFCFENKNPTAICAICNEEFKFISSLEGYNGVMDILQADSSEGSK